MGVRKGGAETKSVPKSRADRFADRSAEEARHVDAPLYAALAAEAAEARRRSAPGDPEAALRAAPLLYREARLLDERRYRDWLQLLTEDVIYWVPASPEGEDPRRENAVHLDDRRRLVDRIALIETGILHAQLPPSRTCRILGNIEAWPAAEGTLAVRSNFVVWEYRRGRTATFAGWQEHRLAPRAEGWLIRHKTINLIDCDEPHGNVSFIL